MRVFVTGAFGYAGGAAAAALAQRGARIAVLVRTEAHAALAEARGWEVVRGDLAQIPLLVTAAGASDACLHCAAGEGPAFDALDATASRAMIAALRPGAAFVRHGGTLIWGDTGTRTFDGSEPLAAPPALQARVTLDDALMGGAGARRVVIVCAPLVYGGTGGAIPRALAAAAKALGAMVYPGNGAQVWSLVHVEDWARLMADAVERGPVGGLRVVAAHGQMTLQQVATVIATRLGLPEPRAATERDLESFGPLAVALAQSQRFSGARAVNLLGWLPMHPAETASLAEGIEGFAASPTTP